MNQEKPTPQEVVKRILKLKFPEAKVIFLAGSVVRGEGTAYSDLDLVVVFEKIKTAWRDSFYFEGWPVEVFIHDFETIRYFFTELDYKVGIPSLANMVTQGIEIPTSTEFSDRIKKMAKETIEAGPPAWSPKDLQWARYSVTDLCDDLREPRSTAELVATAVRLYKTLSNFYLRSQRLWSGSGKHIPKRLAQVDLSFAKKFDEAFQNVFSKHDASQVLSLAENVLNPYGGFLFENAFAECPVEWRKAENQTTT
jgi:predicted nucleotidyltransferase